MSYFPWMPNYGQPGGYMPAWNGQRPDMAQGYPQPNQMAPVAAQSHQQGFFVRPVTNREEAVAAQIDFLSPGTFMPDLNNNRVYFKRFNSNTGSCDFMTFTLEQPEQPSEEPAAPEFATKADLQEMREVVKGLARDMDDLKSPGRGGRRIAED